MIASFSPFFFFFITFFFLGLSGVCFTRAAWPEKSLCALSCWDYFFKIVVFFTRSVPMSFPISIFFTGVLFFDGLAFCAIFVFSCLDSALCISSPFCDIAIYALGCRVFFTGPFFSVAFASHPIVSYLFYITRPGNGSTEECAADVPLPAFSVFTEPITESNSEFPTKAVLFTLCNNFLGFLPISARAAFFFAAATYAFKAISSWAPMFAVAFFFVVVWAGFIFYWSKCYM